MGTNKLLEINNLKVVYQTEEEVVQAVNGVNITLNKKETLGLVGETGAGKSTTALSILRLLPKTTGKINDGEIIFNGKNLLNFTEDEIREIRGDSISMIFQDPMSSLNPVFTIGDQIGEVLELHNHDNKSKKDIQKRVDEILELVSIPSFRKKEYPHQFSGGMKQRVVIAIALVGSPELLIADEPTTALDVTIQAQVLEMMADLKETLGTSMILITHDLGVVAQICDKVAIMYAGEIIESGTVQDIFESQDHHPYTIGLFNSIPDLQKETNRLSSIEGLMPDPIDLPTGCKFHPRCNMCFEKCRQEEPPVYMLNDTQQIKCHLFDPKRRGNSETVNRD